jgi:hypothetical protein
MSQRAGGSGSGRPDASRARIDARSNRNPSTCIVSTQYRRLSTIIRRTTEWLALSVLPVPA